MIKRWFKSGKKINSEDKKVLSTPDISGVMPVNSVDLLLNHHTGRITQINELVGLSSTNFERFYLSAIKNYARFVQLLPASEVHHHAGPGGMLTHALEVCVMSLKVRRSYLLSDTGGAEEISKNQDLWTYAVFIAALCHDLAKVAVDQTVVIYDDDYREQAWEPWVKFIDEQGKWYTSTFVRKRQYRLHEKATPLLINRIISSQGMKWIGSDPSILSKWVACLSGDMDNASSIGEIISIADGKSVASNLGADNSIMSTVKTKPLHEKILTALRHLLNEGELPLNRNGAAGWIIGDDCWLVSKRTVDAIREQLTQEGHSGIPSKNGRLFDILQEHDLIIPFGEKAIWPTIIEGEGWSNHLTLIKVDAKKIWTNPAQRPESFVGSIIVDDGKEKINTGQAANKINTPVDVVNRKPAVKQEVIDDEMILPDLRTNNDETKKPAEVLKKVAYKTLEPLEQASSNAMEEDELLAFLPSINTEQTNDELVTTDALEINLDKSLNKSNKIKSEDFFLIHNDSKAGEGHNFDSKTNQVILFFEWIKNGIKSGELKTNQPKARIHVVNEGVILITPSIFQDFARSLNEKDTSKWTVIQQKVLKKNWHIRNEKGLNVIKYKVKGKSKSTTINAVLFQDVSKVFGSKEPPASNPHFVKVG